MREIILQYLKEHEGFITKEELKKKLKIKGEEQTESFFGCLEALVEDGGLFFDCKKGYHLFDASLGLAYGELEINKAGNGFVHTNDGYTIFIEHEYLSGALNGDKVLVDSIGIGKKDDFRGKIKRIIKRKNGNLIFLVVGNGYKAVLEPYDKNINISVVINKNKLRKLVDGEIILVKVGVEKLHDKYIGEIDKVIGHKNDPGVDLKLIYARYGIPVEFSLEALKEAENLPMEVSGDDLIGRVDLRDKNIITIDCDNTKDRDDAVYLERLSNGNYKLYTSISHVSYYVKKGSSLYKEAIIRNNSYYPNNTCNPMFPPKLSNGICSLNEGVDRLARTCEIEFDEYGNVVDYKIYCSVINSRKAMKYSEVNKVLEGQNILGYEPYVNQLKLMEELCDILEKARKDRNCIDFGIPDIEIVQDKFGKAEKFNYTGFGKAERIIENFMLITGTVVAEHYSWLPFIYRVHESPDEEVVKNVIKTLKMSGFDIPKFTNIDETTIKNIIDRFDNSDEAKIVRTILLKSMKRARYDTNNIGHFALQLPSYCHFTSPIRRITDFKIHMLIDEIENLDYTKEAMQVLEKELLSVAKSASNADIIAQSIEQEALAMAMAEYMEEHIGEGYDAIITEIYQHGMFVKTNEMISGKVKFEDMVDDRYFYDSAKRVLVGKNTKKRYQIGNKIYVIVKDACKETRTINFGTAVKEGSMKKVLKKNKY